MTLSDIAASIDDSGTEAQHQTEEDAAVLAYDSDQEPLADQVVISSWRLDPQESLSDWTIEVVVNGTIHETYHVHKQNLAVGPRRSEYFVKLFAEGGRFAEAENRTSRIELESIAAESFPLLLDYMYLPEREHHFETESSTALYSMAKYFDMRRLRFEAKNFWKVDIERARSCGTYYEHSWLLHEEKIKEAATNSCARNIVDISRSSRLVRIPEPNFWLRILRQERKRDSYYLHVSTLIAEFAQHNLGSLDADVFERLTDQNLLPRVHVEAALPLIDAERQIKCASISDELSSLQKRCIEAIATHWDQIDFAAKSAAMELAKKQSPLVLAEILSATLSAAKTEKTSHAAELSNFHRLKVNNFLIEEYTGVESLPSLIPEQRETRGQSWRSSSYHPAYPLFYYKK